MREHNQNKANPLSSRKQPRCVSPQKCMIKTMPTHWLKKARPEYVSQEFTAKTRPTHPLKKVGSAYVSLEESTLKIGWLTSYKEWPEHVSSEECIVKGMLTHHLKKNGQSMCFRSVQNKMQESLHPEKGNCTPWSPEECTRKGEIREWVTRKTIVNGGTAYSLTNGRFRREMSQDKVISEII